jgi:uncharacterized protein
MLKIETRPALIALGVVAFSPWIIGAGGYDSSQANNSNTLVAITGVGFSEQKVQLITISAGVENFGTDASDAMEENADTMERLRSELRKSGIDPKDIRSNNMSLSKGSKHNDSNGGSIEGFNVHHQLSVVFREAGKAGAVMDALVKAGATQINGPSFSWEASEAGASAARAVAIRDANQRAQFYAQALGLKVRRVVTMSDSGGYASGQPAPMLRADVAGGGTSIDLGQDVIRVSVSGQYELVK